MSQINPPASLIAALSGACDPLFDLIDHDPTLAPLGERLILALLHEAKQADFRTILLARRLRARLDRSKRHGAAPSALPLPRIPRRG